MCYKEVGGRGVCVDERERKRERERERERERKREREREREGGGVKLVIFYCFRWY